MVTLDRGSTVLLYTDGLIERRDADLDAGLVRLRETLLELADRPLEEMLDEVIDRLVHGRPEDDVALVAVRLHRQDRPRPAEAGPNDGAAGRAAAAARLAQARSRRTVALRPLIIVALSARTTSSAADSAPTRANRWWISIDPTSFPVRPVSPVIAPTRSPGRIPASRPAPIHRRAPGPEDRAPRGRGPSPRLPLNSGFRLGSRSARKETTGISSSSSPPAARRPRSRLHRRDAVFDDVELVGEQFVDGAQALELCRRAGFRAGRRG